MSLPLTHQVQKRTRSSHFETKCLLCKSSTVTIVHISFLLRVCKIQTFCIRVCSWRQQTSICQCVDREERAECAQLSSLLHPPRWSTSNEADMDCSGITSAHFQVHWLAFMELSTVENEHLDSIISLIFLCLCVMCEYSGWQRADSKRSEASVCRKYFSVCCREKKLRNDGISFQR